MLGEMLDATALPATRAAGATGGAGSNGYVVHHIRSNRGIDHANWRWNFALQIVITLTSGTSESDRSIAGARNRIECRSQSK